MKRFLALSLLGSSFLFGYSSAKAEYDSFGINFSDETLKFQIWGIDSSSGNSSLLTSKSFDGGGWTGDGFVNAASGELVIKSLAGTFHAYKWKSNEWRNLNNTSVYQQIFSKPTAFNETQNSVQIGSDGNDVDILEDGINIDGEAFITKNSDGSIQIGSDADEIDISSEGLKIAGNSLIKQTSNGEIHIGKNSLITTSEDKNGLQPLYAKDSSGNRIPINIEGSKLLINGRDVEQSIDNIGALSAALTALPTVPKDSPISCGIGTGTHSGNYAFSGGCASRLNEKLSFNAAASFVPGQNYQGTSNSYSARAGFVFKLGELNKPTQISFNDKKIIDKKIANLIKDNQNLKTKNDEIISQNQKLLARLEKLENIALKFQSSSEMISVATKD